MKPRVRVIIIIIFCCVPSPVSFSAKPSPSTALLWPLFWSTRHKEVVVMCKRLRACTLVMPSSLQASRSACQILLAGTLFFSLFVFCIFCLFICSLLQKNITIPKPRSSPSAFPHLGFIFCLSAYRFAAQCLRRSDGLSMRLIPRTGRQFVYQNFNCRNFRLGLGVVWGHCRHHHVLGQRQVPRIMHTFIQKTKERFLSLFTCFLCFFFFRLINP